MARFVKASLQGWEYAREHTEEAADIVLENDATGAQTEKHQKRMMVEIAKLLGTDKPGYLDPAAYQRTVAPLLDNPSNPDIPKEPDGAWKIGRASCRESVCQYVETSG